MVPLACLALLLLLSTYGWSQAESDGAGIDIAMHTPPPVSIGTYSTDSAMEAESNYWSAGVTVDSGYTNNVVPGNGSPVGSAFVSIWPTFAISASTSRLNGLFKYDPGVTFYPSVGSRNQLNQRLALDLEYQLTPHTTASVRDSFRQTSNPFDQPNPLSNPVSGSTPAPDLALIVPAADQIYNLGEFQVTYQFGPNSMLGSGGTFTNLYYPKPEEAPGLYNSNSSAGSAFYSRRIREKHYVGLSYRYMDVSAYRTGVPGTQSQVQSVFFFVTLNLKPTLSLSFSGGPQYYKSTQAPLPVSASWSPLITASFGWQGQRTSLAASYSRIVTGGGGLAGAYHSTLAGVSVKWQFSRTWNVGIGGNYWLYDTLTPFFFGSSSGGHSVAGTVAFERRLGEYFTMRAGYTRIQQSYAGIPAISTYPNSNREFLTVSYRVTKSLKR